MHAPLLALVLGLTNPAPSTAIDTAVDWASTGTDCPLYAAGDVDGDGFADLLTINGNNDLCVAYSVKGWKASPWEVLAHNMAAPTEYAALAVGDFDTRQPGMEVAAIAPHSATVLGTLEAGVLKSRADLQAPEGSTLSLDAARTSVRATAGTNTWLWRDGLFKDPIPAEPPATPPPPGPDASGTAPPYDPQAELLTSVTADLNGDGVPDTAFVYRSSLPHPSHAVRVRFGLSTASDDQDGDGLTDAQEASIGSNPAHRDTDGDGLLDGWEVHGLPRGIGLGDFTTLYDQTATGDAADQQLNPLRQDVIVNVSYFEGVDPSQFRREMPRVQQAFRELHSDNPDGSHGVFVHFRVLPRAVPRSEQNQAWWDIGNANFPARERGLMHWMQVTPHGGGQSGETADMGGCGNNWHVFAHEFGHQLGLSHTGDSSPAWCPLYTSMMNYAYHYAFDGDGNKSHFSTGEFRATVLDERHLVEKLDYPFDRLKFLANRPFQFLLKDNGDGTTLVDWNQNGVFDEGTVEADINYGGGTSPGETKPSIGLTGSATALAYVGDRCLMAYATHLQNAVVVRAFSGGDAWTSGVSVDNSATRSDPVLAGSPSGMGVLLIRRFDGWWAARVRPGTPGEEPRVSGLHKLESLAATDVSAIAVGDRFLLVARHDDHRLERSWLTIAEDGKPSLGEAAPLTLTSMTPVGMVTNPADHTITVVSAGKDDTHGPFGMQVSSFTVDGDTVTESAPSWTHGRNACTSRPSPVYRTAPAGAPPQLVIFHTGWPDGIGTWSSWRTTRVGNTAANGGWITSELINEWNRARVAVSFADGPQGTVYAFRWDTGDYHEWKVNTAMIACGNGYGIDTAPMRDFDDGAKISRWGIRQSILNMRRAD